MMAKRGRARGPIENTLGAMQQNRQFWEFQSDAEGRTKTWMQGGKMAEGVELTWEAGNVGGVAVRGGSGRVGLAERLGWLWACSKRLNPLPAHTRCSKTVGQWGRKPGRSGEGENRLDEDLTRADRRQGLMSAGVQGCGSTLPLSGLRADCAAAQGSAKSTVSAMASKSRPSRIVNDRDPSFSPAAIARSAPTGSVRYRRR